MDLPLHTHPTYPNKWIARGMLARVLVRLLRPADASDGPNRLSVPSNCWVLRNGFEMGSKLLVDPNRTESSDGHCVPGFGHHDSHQYACGVPRMTGWAPAMVGMGRMIGCT